MGSADSPLEVALRREEGIIDAPAVRMGGLRHHPGLTFALAKVRQLRERMQHTAAARIAGARERALTGEGRERVGPGRQVPLPVDYFNLEVEPAALLACGPDHILGLQHAVLEERRRRRI